VKARFVASCSLATSAILGCFLTSSCTKNETSANTVAPAGEGVSVGVVKVGRRTLGRTMTISSELVPFQEIDVYAKESGFVKTLNVDYGSRVKTGDVMAVLEIPELELQLQQDDAAIKNASGMITHAQHELNRAQAQSKVLHLQYDRLNGVAKSKPGLVAQQEVDDAQGKDLAAQAQVEASESSLESAKSQLELTQAKRRHDQVLFDYSKITAPFDGVVTQRYANLGTLMQAGTASSTQALPLVKLSQDDKFRLVIPVPESYVKYIRVGDQVQVSVPSLNHTFPGRVTRFSVDVKEETRTMHTEVDVPNPDHRLVPGLYAEATVTLDGKGHALAVPLQAVDQVNDKATVDVVGSSNRIEIRQITLGIQTATDAEVVSGLQEGDKVVVSDRSSLRAGQVVEPKVMELMRYQSGEANK
jgi:RND family efflux transporter MFP subunit